MNDKPQETGQGLNQKVCSRVGAFPIGPTRTDWLPVYRADLNHPVNLEQHGNAVCLARLAAGQTLPRGGLGEWPWDDRRSQSRPVTGRICPRRSGLAGREKTVEAPHPGKAIDKRRQPLDASRSWCPQGHGWSSGNSVSPSCWRDTPSRNGSARNRLALARFEPCEGKLSRTVLRGAWAGQPPAPTRRLAPHQFTPMSGAHQADRAGQPDVVPCAGMSVAGGSSATFGRRNAHCSGRALG